MQISHSIQPATTTTSPAFRGRHFPFLVLAAVMTWSAAAHASEPEPVPPQAAASPYSDLQQPDHPSQQGAYAASRHPSKRHAHTGWTGLKLESGSRVKLIFGNDPYQDGAALAAILRGLEAGEVLLIERTETGVRLRRQGRPAGSAYDFLEFDHGVEREQP